MARTGFPLTGAEDALMPLFADPAREYHWVHRWQSWQRDDNSVRFAAHDEENNPLTVRLTLVDPAVLRVQLLTAETAPAGRTGPPTITTAATPPPPAKAPGGAIPVSPSPARALRGDQGDPADLQGGWAVRSTTLMLVRSDWPRVTLSVEERDTGLWLRTSALVIDVDREPWRLRVSAAGRPLYRQEAGDLAAGRYAAVPFGYSIGADGRVAAHETFALDVDEHLYGLGSLSGALNRRGVRHIGWLRATDGGQTMLATSTPIPFFQSSRGYGVFVNHGERITYELGNPSAVSAAFRVEAPALDYFLIAGPDPKTILRRYTDLTGRPALPPLWSFGVRLSLSRHPHVRRGSPMYTDAVARGLLARLPDGSPACSTDDPDAALIDVTNPAAIPWMEHAYARLSERGVAVEAADTAGVPVEAVFHTGETGWQLHNVYPLLHHRAVFAAAEKANGVGEAVTLARAGYAGSQRYPLLCSDEAPPTWGGMAGSLRSGLSLAMNGVAFWSAEVGGADAASAVGTPAVAAAVPATRPAVALPDPTLSIRWMQWALLCSHARIGDAGVSAQRQLENADQVVSNLRAFVRLRAQLAPYLWSLAHEATETGTPLMRPLVLEFPRDPVAPHTDGQFMLGPSLLVCPVLNAEGRMRVYLPEGRWHDWWQGTVYEGPRHLEVTVPLDRLPLFVRDGSILPLAPPSSAIAAAVWSPLELQVRGEAQADLVLWTPDRRVAIRSDRRNARLRVRIENATQQWQVRLVGIAAHDTALTGAASDLTWSVEHGDTVAAFSMNGQGSAQFTATVGRQ